MGTLCGRVHDDFLARLLRVGNGSDDGIFCNLVGEFMVVFLLVFTVLRTAWVFYDDSWPLVWRRFSLNDGITHATGVTT